jgi:hypothetical protein
VAGSEALHHEVPEGDLRGLDVCATLQVRNDGGPAGLGLRQ